MHMMKFCWLFRRLLIKRNPRWNLVVVSDFHVNFSRNWGKEKSLSLLSFSVFGSLVYFYLCVCMFEFAGWLGNKTSLKVETGNTFDSSLFQYLHNLSDL